MTAVEQQENTHSGASGSNTGEEKQGTVIYAYDSDCDELNSAKIALLWRICQEWLDALTECHNQALDTMLDSIIKKRVFKDLKEMQNVEKQDSLMKTVSDLKKDLKMEETRNIDREIALEKKIKQLDNIIFKRESSGVKAKSCYDGNVILKMDTIVIPDSDETLMLCEESRSKMLLKEQDPMVLEGALKRYSLLAALIRLSKKEPLPQLSLRARGGVRLSTSASGSQPSGNTRNDKILQTPSSNSKNKVEAHPRNVKSSLNKRNGTVKVNGSAYCADSKKTS
ncbi:hypothetical protein Tco_0071659 [Tanacetum coccineum]